MHSREVDAGDGDFGAVGQLPDLVRLDESRSRGEPLHEVGGLRAHGRVRVGEQVPVGRVYPAGGRV
jgi:hypothetical protein